MNIPDFEVIGMKGERLSAGDNVCTGRNTASAPENLKAKAIPALLMHQCQRRLQNQGSALQREKAG